MIYTIGYQQLIPGQLRELAEAINVTVVDVRGRPVSRRPGFGRRQLETLLGPRYQWRGDQLGGVHHLANATALWPEGLRKLAAEVERPLLLCQCHAPGGCHRHQLALGLNGGGHHVVHLFEREAIRSLELERSIADGDLYDAITWADPRELIAEFEAET